MKQELDKNRYEDKDVHNLVTYDTVLAVQREARIVLDKKKKKEQLTLERAGEIEKLTVDEQTMRVFKGIERGVVMELAQAGLGDLIKDISDKYNGER